MIWMQKPQYITGKVSMMEYVTIASAIYGFYSQYKAKE
jgi:hypothetical protein